MKITRISKQLAADTKGAVAIIVAVALPVILGFGALALEYGAALVVKSENQRTSDTAEFAAAFEYKKRLKDNTNTRVSAAKAAAESVAALNGVSSGITISFDDPADASYVDVEISEGKQIFLSRLINRNDNITINTSSRVSLGEAGGFVPCIMALDSSAKEGFRVNGGGTYNMTGCGIGANAEIEVNGQTIETSCAAPTFKKTGKTCEDETEKSGFTDPYADVTNWPNEPNDYQEKQICDFIGKFPDDIATKVSDKDYQLKNGVLCVDEFSKKFDSVFSDSTGNGNTLIVKAGVDFDRKGNYNISITPPKIGSLAGVAIYAPYSALTLGGNPEFSIDGLGCSGLVSGSMRFNGNVTFNAECDRGDVNFGAGGGGPAGRPRLVQ